MGGGIGRCGIFRVFGSLGWVNEVGGGGGGGGAGGGAAGGSCWAPNALRAAWRAREVVKGWWLFDDGVLLLLLLLLLWLWKGIGLERVGGLGETDRGGGGGAAFGACVTLDEEVKEADDGSGGGRPK